MVISKQLEFFNPVAQEVDVDFSSYDKIIIAFSGGKDSLACLLHLLDLGVDKARLELFHHDVDGRESERLFDWPCTRSYCQAIADAFEIPIYFSWREGGFEREMLRENSLTGGVYFENAEGKHYIPSTDRPAYYNTRRKYPQVSGDLSVRFCSAYLKIDVAASVLRNDLRFRNIKTLFITGERGEESSNRAKYKQLEEHKADLRGGNVYQRHIDHYRPVLYWKEDKVWDIIRKHKVQPHPAYYIGFSRTSCMCCIFLNEDSFKTVSILDPSTFQKLVEYEKDFGYTMKRNMSLTDYIKRGKAFEYDQLMADGAMAEEFFLPVFTSEWTLPQGAFKGGCGPS